MKIAIVGSRDYDRLDQVIAYVQSLPHDTHIVTGDARGVDNAALVTAYNRGMNVTCYPAAWAEHGKKAGMLRNSTIVEAADKVVAFWDGKSRGTRDSLIKAHAQDKILFVQTPEGRYETPGVLTSVLGA